MFRTKDRSTVLKETLISDNRTCLERSNVLKPTRKKPSGLLAVALGITTAVASMGLLSDYMPVNSAFAQYQQPNPQMAAVSQPTAQNVVPVMQQQTAPVANPAALLQQSNQLLVAARTSLAGGDVTTAEQQLQQAAALRVPYTERDDRPEYVKSLIEGHKNWLQNQAQYGNSDHVRRLRAENLADQADGFYRHNNLDMAEKLAQSAIAQNIGVSTEMANRQRDPQSIMNRINDAKIVRAAQNNTLGTANGPAVISAATQRQAQDMLPYLAQARQLLQAGRVAEADVAAQKLLAANVPDSAFATVGDSPSLLMVDIAKTRQMMSQQTTSGIQQPTYNPALDAARVVPVQATISGPTTVPGGMPTSADSRTPTETVGDMSRQASEYEFAAEIQRQITRSQQLMSEELPKMNDAITNLQEARAKVESSDISQDMKRNLFVRVDRELAQMEDFRAKHGSAIQMAQDNADVREALAKEREDRSYVEMKLKEFTEEYRELYKQERYAEAEAVAAKARAIAPNHTVVVQMEEQSKIAGRQYEMDSIKRAKEKGVYEWIRDQEYASIPMVNDRTPLIGPAPKTWDAIQNRTSIGMLGEAQTEGEQKIYQALKSNIKLNTNGLQPLRAVVERLMAETGININIDSQALADITSVDMAASDVSVELNNMYEVKLESALSTMLAPHGLTYTVRHESLLITTPKRSRAGTKYKAYYVGDLTLAQVDNRRYRPKTATERFKQAMEITMGRNTSFGVNPGAMNAVTRPVSMQNMGNQSSNSRIPGFVNAQIGMDGGYRPGGNNFGNGGYGGYGNDRSGSAGGGADFSELIYLIQETIDPDSWSQSSGGGRQGTGTDSSISSDSGTEEQGEATIMPFYNTLTLIIRQTEDNHQQIQDLLTQLRKMNDIQISVEVRFITIKDDFFESIGVDFDFNIRNGQNSTYGGLNALGTTTTTGGTGTTGTTGTTSSLNSGVFNQTVKSANMVAGLLAGPDGLNGPVFSPDLGISVNQNSIGLAQPTFGGYQNAAGASFGFAILSDIETYFFMNAAQGDSRSNVLQAPKVTVINGQYGTVSDMSQRYFVTSVVPVVGDFAVALQPMIEIIEEGTELSVQAVVSSDRRYVRMNLMPYFSTIGDTVGTFSYDGSSTISGETSTSTGGGTTNSSEVSNSGAMVQQPLTTTFSVMTSVSVPDGGTILLGGVKRLSEGRKEYGVPMVSKIPYLKRLFSNTAVGRETQSMMMMVTPHIIIQEEYEASMSSATEN